MWQREAASKRPASCGLIDFKSSIGEPLIKISGKLLLLFEVDQIFVIPKDFNIGVGPPSSLDLLSRHSLLALL